MGYENWSLPIFDSLPIRTPSNPPILTSNGVAPATAFMRTTVKGLSRQRRANLRIARDVSLLSVL